MKFKNFKYLFIVIIFFIFIFLIKDSYAYNNYFDDIPDISTLTSADLNLPSKYDLRDVDGVNFVTPVKDQGSYSLCWAFSATTAFESSLKKSGYVDSSFNDWLSPYQVDALVTPNSKVPNINYVTTNSHMLGGGENAIYDLGLAFKAFTTAYSPVLMDNFNELKYRSTKDKYKFYSEDIYNEKNSNFYLTDYDILYNSFSDSQTSVNDLTLVDIVKYYVYNYGGVVVNTKSPSNYCDDYDAVCHMSAKENIGYGLHAMTIIGWDDNENAWILQNSWGDSLSYLYLSYDSYVTAYIGLKKISKTNNWDNRYYATINSDGSASYKKIRDNVEIIDSILVDIVEAGNYSLYLYNGSDGSDYELISTFEAKFKGRKTINLLDKNLILSSDNFAIQIKRDDNRISTNNIYVFTRDVNNTTSTKKIYLYDINDLNSALQTFSIKYKGINLEKDKLSFRIKNEVNQDITDKFNLIGSYFSNNYGQLDYSIKFDNSSSSNFLEYKVEAVYEGYVIGTKSFNVSNFKNFKKGSGTKEDPFIITEPSDFAIISSDFRFYNYSYKLGRDINMSGIDFTSIGETRRPFTGVFDGNNYTISNLNIPSNYMEGFGFFGAIENAVIKNIRFRNCSIDVYSDTSGGFVAGISRSSTIENIYVDGGSVVINNTYSSYGNYGTIVGSIYNGSKLYNVFSSMNIEVNNVSNISDSIYLGGLVGTIWSSDFDNTIISTSSYSGTINYNNISKNSNIGGIVGRCEHVNSIFDNIKVAEDFSINNLNYSSYVGYFVGFYASDYYLNVSNSIYYKNDNNINIGDNAISIVGNNDYDGYKNIYAITDYDVEGNDKYINKNSDRFLNKNLNNLDFNDVWYMCNNGPELRVLTIDSTFKNERIGDTDIYNIDYDNMIISNVKTNNGSLTVKEFVEGFITFSGEIYSSDGTKIVLDDELIKTGMIIKKNNKEMKVIVVGDINRDGKVTMADIVLLRRYQVDRINLDNDQIMAADINQDGRSGGADVAYLRRGLAGGYDNVCSKLWRNC